MKRYDEYSERGDYHRELSKDWSYYPTYLRKTQVIENILASVPRDKRVLDVGCGEGVFVEALRKKGFDAFGVDKNYSSKTVLQGDILSLPLRDGVFDLVLFLDVIEHLDFRDQERGLDEVRRVAKPDGTVIISIPNLAHFYSRVRFLLRGKLARTASIEKHPGDRPISEFMELLKKKGFVVEKRYGIFPTFPLLYKQMQRHPRQTLWLYNLMTRLFPYPNFSFLNIVVCRLGKK